MEDPPKYFNAVVRSGDTLVLHTSGGTSTGLDCYVYPKSDDGGREYKAVAGCWFSRAVFLSAANPGR